MGSISHSATAASSESAPPPALLHTHPLSQMRQQGHKPTDGIFHVRASIRFLVHKWECECSPHPDDVIR